MINKEKEDYDLEFSRDYDVPDEDLTDAQKAARYAEDFATALDVERSRIIQQVESEVHAKLSKSYNLYVGVKDSDGNDTFERSIPQPTSGSVIYQNITRQITNDGVNQLGDLLFPSDDRNYGVKEVPLTPPPVSIAMEGAIDAKGEALTDAEGNQLSNQQYYERLQVKLRRKVKRMFTKMDGALIAAKYPEKARQVIRDAGIFGTGILKGPIPGKVSLGRWAKAKGGQWKLRPSEKLEPDVQVVSPFDFFPDMSASNLDEAGYIWERSYLHPEDLAKDAKKKGWNPEIVERLLASGVHQVDTDGSIRDQTRAARGLNSLRSEGRYVIWERHGWLNHTQCEHLPMEVPEKFADGGYGIVTMCNSRVLNVVFSPYENPEHMYSVYNWDEDPFCIFGDGIPILMDQPQHIYNSAWRMAVDNAGLAAIPQVVINKKTIEPADPSEAGDYTLRPGKQWFRTGSEYSNEGSADPFALMAIQQDIQQLFVIIDKATNDAYELSGVTRVNKANAGLDNAPVTLGATQIVQNNNSVSRRGQARRWDDQITSTLIRRVYEFFMQFEDDDEIKADMAIEPRGSTVLLSKELVASNLMQLYQVTANGKEEGVKPLALLRAIASSMQFSEGRFVETEDEEEMRIANAQDAVSPEQQMQQQELELKQQELQLKMQELQLRERDVSTKEAQIELEHSRLQVDAQMQQQKLLLESQKHQDSVQVKVAQMQGKAEEVMNKLSVDMEKLNKTDSTNRDIAHAGIQSKREGDSYKDSIRAKEIEIKARDTALYERELNHKISTGQEGV